MRVLVACEYSGRVRDAFTRNGHHAMSVDLLPSDRPGLHYQGDVFDVIDGNWDLMVAHPPCTYLALSGVRWLHDKDDERKARRWENLAQSAEFFDRLLHAPIPRIAVENPIMHRYGRALIDGKPTQTVQPWQFGHGETKATVLWLKNLPQLEPTEIVGGERAPYPQPRTERRPLEDSVDHLPRNRGRDG